MMRKSLYNNVYIICADIVVCALLLWGLSNEIDFKDAEREITQAVTSWNGKLAFDKSVEKAADVKSKEASEPEEVKRRLTIVGRKLQQVLNSNQKFDNKFGPRIDDWDNQSEIAKAKLSRFGNDTAESAADQSPKPRILLVTSSHVDAGNACSNKRGDQMLLLKSRKNKMDYCRLHDIQLFYNMPDKMEDEMSSWWAKVFFTHMLMVKHPEVDWIWWMDSDAIFTDMSFALPLQRYENYNMVLQGWEDAVYEKRNWLGLNTGVFLLRNCQWSMDLLHAWASMSPKGAIRDAIGPLLTKALPGRPEGEADDQSALVYLMVKEREKWGSKVYLENSDNFQAYWRTIYKSENLKEIQIDMAKDKVQSCGLCVLQPWPFVTHFCGCEFCGQLGNYNPDQNMITQTLCIEKMEQAINFADNQVINQVENHGLQHPTISEVTTTNSSSV